MYGHKWIGSTGSIWTRHRLAVRMLDSAWVAKKYEIGKVAAMLSPENYPLVFGSFEPDVQNSLAGGGGNGMGGGEFGGGGPANDTSVDQAQKFAAIGSASGS